MLFLEMVKDGQHGDLLVQAAAETGLPVVVGMTLDVQRSDDAAGSPLVTARDEPTLTVEEMVNRWQEHDAVVGFSAMHCSAADTEDMVRAIRRAAGPRAFVAAYPNQGHWVPPDWTVEEPISPKEYRKYATAWRDA